MIQVKDGKIVQTAIPLYGMVNGNFYSRCATAPRAELIADGWKDVVHTYPEYDATYYELSAPTYTYDSKVDKVKATYTVIGKPEQLLKKRIDELESKLTITEDKATKLKTVLIDKDIIEEADLLYTEPETAK